MPWKLPDDDIAYPPKKASDYFAEHYKRIPVKTLEGWRRSWASDKPVWEDASPPDRKARKSEIYYRRSRMDEWTHAQRSQGKAVTTRQTLNFKKTLENSPVSQRPSSTYREEERELIEAMISDREAMGGLEVRREKGILWESWTPGAGDVLEIVGSREDTLNDAKWRTMVSAAISMPAQRQRSRPKWSAQLYHAVRIYHRGTKVNSSDRRKTYDGSLKASRGGAH